jgi:hypothetical protein
MWTRYNIMWYSLSMTWGSSVGFSINKTDRHHIDEILLKVGLNPMFPCVLFGVHAMLLIFLVFCVFVFS